MAALRLVFKKGVSRFFRKSVRSWHQEPRVKLQSSGLLGKVIEELRNEASQVAMDSSDDELRGEDAIDVLAERELKTTLSHSRKKRQSLSSGLARGMVVRYQDSRTYQRRLTPHESSPFDENTTVSDNLVTDYALDCRNIRKDVKKVIEIVYMNLSDFGLIATASRKQHADIHKRESRSKHEEDRPRAYRTFTSSKGTTRHTSERIKAAVRSRQLWILRRTRTPTMTEVAARLSPTRPSRS